MSSGDILLDPYHGLVLKIIEDGDKLTMKEHWTHKAHGGNALTVHDGVLYLGHKSMLYAYDLASGEEVPHLQSKVKRPWGLGGWKSGLVVGNRVLGVVGGGAVNKTIYRDAPYRFYNPAQFPVSSIPEGRMLSGKTDNWLAVASKRAAPETIPQAQRFISETLNGDHLGSQDAGLPGNFSYGGPFAHGHRLLIPSLTHLYCIGPAVKGTADDDPAVAAGIAKSDDGDALLKHLTSDSAQYRWEAVKRLAAVGALKAKERLLKLADEDRYEEIRAAAIQTLDTIANRPGTALVQAKIKKRFAEARPPKGIGTGLFCRTLHELGADLDQILVPLLAKDAKAEDRLAATRASRWMVLQGGDALRDALIKLLSDENAEVRNNAAWALSIRLQDEKLRPIFEPAVVGADGQLVEAAYRWLSRQTDVAGKMALSKRVIADSTYKAWSPQARLIKVAVEDLMRIRPRPTDLTAWFLAQAKAGNHVVLENLIVAAPMRRPSRSTRNSSSVPRIPASWPRS